MIAPDFNEVQALLNDLAGRGITLHLQGLDQLKATTTRTPLTDADRAALRRLKSDLVAALRAQRGHTRPAGEAPAPIPFPGTTTDKQAPGLVGMTARELQQKRFPDQRHVIPGIIMDGAATLFAGGPKKGKSWCNLGWALAVARGGKAFGTLNVEQGRVLYLALEDGERRLQARIDLMMQQDATPWPENLHLYTEWPRLDNGGLPLLVGFIDEHPDTRLIMIDTLKKIRPRGDRQSSPYDLDYDAVSGLSKLAQDRNVAIIITHHTRKAKADDVLEEISGTNGLSGGCDGGLVMHRDRGSADSLLKLVHRDAEEIDIPLRWDVQISGWVMAGNAEFLKLSAPKAKILQALKDHGGLMTPKEISAAAGVLYGTVRNVLPELLHTGRLFAPEYGRYSYTNLHDTHDSGDSRDTDDTHDNGAEQQCHEQPPQCHPKTARHDNFEHRVMSVMPLGIPAPEPPDDYSDLAGGADWENF